MQLVKTHHMLSVHYVAVCSARPAAWMQWFFQVSFNTQNTHLIIYMLLTLYLCYMFQAAFNRITWDNVTGQIKTVLGNKLSLKTDHIISLTWIAKCLKRNVKSVASVQFSSRLILHKLFEQVLRLFPYFALHCSFSSHVSKKLLFFNFRTAPLWCSALVKAALINMFNSQNVERVVCSAKNTETKLCSSLSPTMHFSLSQISFGSAPFQAAAGRCFNGKTSKVIVEMSEHDFSLRRCYWTQQS